VEPLLLDAEDLEVEVLGVPTDELIADESPDRDRTPAALADVRRDSPGFGDERFGGHGSPDYSHRCRREQPQMPQRTQMKEERPTPSVSSESVMT
jgi:hypothetical protein